MPFTQQQIHVTVQHISRQLERVNPRYYDQHKAKVEKQLILAINNAKKDVTNLVFTPSNPVFKNVFNTLAIMKIKLPPHLHVKLMETGESIAYKPNGKKIIIVGNKNAKNAVKQALEKDLLAQAMSERYDYHQPKKVENFEQEEYEGEEYEGEGYEGEEYEEDPESNIEFEIHQILKDTLEDQFFFLVQELEEDKIEEENFEQGISMPDKHIRWKAAQRVQVIKKLMSNRSTPDVTTSLEENTPAAKTLPLKYGKNASKVELKSREEGKSRILPTSSVKTLPAKRSSHKKEEEVEDLAAGMGSLTLYDQYKSRGKEKRYVDRMKRLSPAIKHKTRNR